MTRIRQCSIETVSSIKKVFLFLIKDAFDYRFKYSCPKHLLRRFLPHLLGLRAAWHDVSLLNLADAFGIPLNDLDLVLMQPLLLRPDEGTHPLGARLLQYRLSNNGALPMRLKVLLSWNLSSWSSTSPTDYKLRRCRRLLKSGPICIQETKWKGHEPQALYQCIPGVRIDQSPAIAFSATTGGVAILFPPGWSVIEEIELVKGRAIASLVQDRTCQFYVVSVYIHPDNRNGDAEALLRAWRFLEKKAGHAFVAGDFNGLDKHPPHLWEKPLLQFSCSDVHPELATYRHSRGVSSLDRCLVPDSLTNSAKLYPSASVLTSHVANGHDIVKVRVSVRPNVLNNPKHPKHEVIPSGVFMPGKDGTPVTSTSELQGLVRLLHREHGRLYSHWGMSFPSALQSDLDLAVTGRCSPYDPGVIAPTWLLDAFGLGGVHNCHRSTTPILGLTVEPESILDQVPNGSMSLTRWWMISSLLLALLWSLLPTLCN